MFDFQRKPILLFGVPTNRLFILSKLNLLETNCTINHCQSKTRLKYVNMDNGKVFSGVSRGGGRGY